MAVQLMPNGAEPIGGHRPANDNGAVQRAQPLLPYKDPREGYCKANDNKCRGWAWAGSDHCYAHRPVEDDVEADAE